jgi:hypothetical protein
VSVGGGGGGGYAGPGDVASGASAFWATSMCYSAAYAGNIAVIVDVDPSPNFTTTLGCTAGVVSVTSGSAIATTCASGCFYQKLFDQSGGSNCGGACDIDDIATGALVMPLVANAVNSTSCANSDSSNRLSKDSVFTLAQPFTIYAMWERTDTANNLYAVIKDASSAAGTIRAGGLNAANKAGMYNGNSIVAGATSSDNAYHANLYVFADATQSVIYVDGTGTNQSLGGTDGFTGTGVGVGSSNTGSTGFFCEGGIWPSDLGSTVATSLSANARTRYGSF